MRKSNLLAFALLAWPLMAVSQAQAQTADTGASIAADTPAAKAETAADAKVRHERRQEMRREWKEMTPEERETFKEEHPKAVAHFEKRKEMREKWQSMTPEERQAKKAEMKAKWDAKTPEEKEAWKKNHPYAVKRFQHRQAQKGDQQTAE